MTGQPNQRFVVRLVLVGLAAALLLAIGLWGILTLGSQAVATERYYPPVARIASAYAVVCPAPDTLERRAEPAARAKKGRLVLRSSGPT